MNQKHSTGLIERERYYFDDFTISNYMKLIDIARSDFSFIKFREIEEIDESLNCVLWRHDIDFSPHRALALAKIEYKKNVQSTFFVWLHSLMYHFFEREVVEIFKRILEMGHDIGLHFDSGYYGFLNETQLQAKLSFEKEILEKAIGQSINVFSYHDPGSEFLEYGNYTIEQLSDMYPHYFEPEIAGMINTYSDYLRKNFYYCSDSNGFWRFERLEDILTEKVYERLHVLTHPEWWQDRPMPPRQRIHRCIDGRADNVKFSYDELLQNFGRLNIDEEV